MKKFLIILLILILGYIQIGYFVHFLALRQSAKREVESMKDLSSFNSSFDTFALDDIKKDIEWEEEGKEFWFGGEIYDVVQQTKVNGKTYLYCFNDTKEKEIVTNYMNNTRRKSRSDSHAKYVSFFFSSLYLNSVIPSVYNIPSFIDNRFHSYSEDALSQHREILSPPPKA